MTVLVGDCVSVMAGMDEGSVDAIVTDPPYGLGFMGKEWDALPPGREWAEECLRVLKPGGHLLAFGGARTYHRLTVAVEDAGFEIRDCLSWLYGSGFPKSHNLKGDWEGFGTALKPSWEPIIMARKPLEGTVAANVLGHGTGALNIDGCRVGAPEDKRAAGTRSYKAGRLAGGLNGEGVLQQAPHDGLGRWPANTVLDEDAAAILDAQSGVQTSRASNRGLRYSGRHGGLTQGEAELKPGTDGMRGHSDTGGASRFFYIAKASRRERDAGLDDRNPHPTVKPISLMRWLVRMVTPPEGTVLDPFTGSGTTGCAAALEGFEFIGIEREAEYAAIAESRIEHWTPDQLELA